MDSKQKIFNPGLMLSLILIFISLIMLFIFGRGIFVNDDSIKKNIDLAGYYHPRIIQSSYFFVCLKTGKFDNAAMYKVQAYNNKAEKVLLTVVVSWPKKHVQVYLTSVIKNQENNQIKNNKKNPIFI